MKQRHGQEQRKQQTQKKSLEWLYGLKQTSAGAKEASDSEEKFEVALRA